MPTKDEACKTHLPNEIYAYAQALNLIDSEKSSFETNDGKIEIAISIIETTLQGTSEPWPITCVEVAITDSNSLRTYQFTKQNGYWNGTIDKRGWDYPGAINHSAVLWSNNFFARSTTNVYKSDILAVLRKIAPESEPTKTSTCVIS